MTLFPYTTLFRSQFNKQVIVSCDEHELLRYRDVLVNYFGLKIYQELLKHDPECIFHNNNDATYWGYFRLFIERTAFQDFYEFPTKGIAGLVFGEPGDICDYAFVLSNSLLKRKFVKDTLTVDLGGLLKDKDRDIISYCHNRESCSQALLDRHLNIMRLSNSGELSIGLFVQGLRDQIMGAIYLEEDSEEKLLEFTLGQNALGIIRQEFKESTEDPVILMAMSLRFLTLLHENKSPSTFIQQVWKQLECLLPNELPAKDSFLSIILGLLRKDFQCLFTILSFIEATQILCLQADIPAIRKTYITRNGMNVMVDLVEDHIHILKNSQ